MGASDGWVDGTLNVKTTDANRCVGPDGEGSAPLTNHIMEIIDLRGEDGQGTYKVINTKEPSLLEQIKKLIRENGNDFSLGSEIRKLIGK